MSLQVTLKSAIHCAGVGLHSGARVSLTLAPAEAGTGIRFLRTDLRGDAAVVPARWDHVVDTRLCTVVGNAHGATIGTVEHLMAALRACGVDNAEIRIDGGEVPVMDGSSAPFVFLIECAGLQEQDAPRRSIRILKPLKVEDSGRVASFRPADECGFSFEIDFASAAIARQSAYFRLENGVFRTEIARARTFGFLHEVDAMRKAGLARGGSMDNAVVISGDKVLNEDGLRYADEFVRHKILDAVGDIYMAGAPIIGRFHGVKAGHMMNNRLLRAMFADRSAWTWTTDEPGEAAWIDDRIAAVG